MLAEHAQSNTLIFILGASMGLFEETSVTGGLE